MLIYISDILNYMYTHDRASYLLPFQVKLVKTAIIV